MTLWPCKMLLHRSSVLLIAIALVYITGSTLADASIDVGTASRRSYSQLWEFFSLSANRDAPLESSCTEVPMHVLGKVNLTLEQLSLLPSICWHEKLEEANLEGLEKLEKRSGIPAGVQCAKTQW